MNEFVIEDGVLTKYYGRGGHVVIPESVTKICDDAFYYCSSIQSVIIPKNVTIIGGSAFEGCKSIL